MASSTEKTSASPHTTTTHPTSPTDGADRPKRASTPHPSRLLGAKPGSAAGNEREETIETPERCRMCGDHRLQEIGSKEGYHFFECTNCGFVFTPVEDEEVKRAGCTAPYEEEEPEADWADDLEFLQEAFQRLQTTRLNVLDFGCGESFATDRLRAMGHRVIGVDQRPPKRNEGHPDRLTGDILRLPLEPGQFDLVYAYQVFEHLPHPLPVLRRLLDLTRDRGYVLIHTDMQMPEREEAPTFIDWWYVMPPNHCSFYVPESFAKALPQIDPHAGHCIVHEGPKSMLIQCVKEPARQATRKRGPAVEHAAGRQRSD